MPHSHLCQTSCIECFYHLLPAPEPCGRGAALGRWPPLRGPVALLIQCQQPHPEHCSSICTGRLLHAVHVAVHSLHSCSHAVHVCAFVGEVSHQENKHGDDACCAAVTPSAMCTGCWRDVFPGGLLLDKELLDRMKL